MRAVRPVEGVYELDVEGRRIVSGTQGLDGVLVEVTRGAKRVREG